MTEAHINRIATAVPPYDVHQAFLQFGHALLDGNARSSTLFGRMAERAGIDHRYSYLNPAARADGASTSAYDFYRRGEFPTPAARMRLFESQAPALAEAAVERLHLGPERASLTHILITCCTGFSAPGLDLEIISRCRLPSSNRPSST